MGGSSPPMTVMVAKKDVFASKLSARFAQSMTALDAPWPVAIAVSGGGDSMALMWLASAWAKKKKLSPPHILTVDHGLRAESKNDAAFVVKAAKAL
ncbi:MAG TPA: ATP-binding protein, partial [Rhizomicrobium sp.]|nr:ATP-binding protein [Rhizomicrobium sp.]